MSQLKMETFVDDYLKRLQYSGSVAPNLETLRTLHHLHMLNIPFENLNNILKKEYPSTKQDLYKKIILEHRGGVCFELNSLFAFLLQDLGYQVTIVEAVVYSTTDNGWFSFPSHQLSMVTLGKERWIVDVGYGEGFTVPLRFVEDEIQDDGKGVYRIKKYLTEACQEWFVIESLSKDIVADHFIDIAEKSEDDVKMDWEYKYKFSLTPRSNEHFAEARYRIQNEPESPFNKGLVCTMLRPWGRITISRYKLIKKYVEGKKTIRKDLKMLQSQEEVILALKSEFGFMLQHPESLLIIA